MSEIVPVFSKNYEDKIKSVSYENKELKDYFEKIEQSNKEKGLRTSSNYVAGNLLSFNKPLREIPVISDYLYKGDDFAKNYLIDNGFFVPDDSIYEQNKRNYYQFRKTHLVENVDYYKLGQGIKREELNKALDKIDADSTIPEQIRLNARKLKKIDRINYNTIDSNLDYEYSNPDNVELGFTLITTLICFVLVIATSGSLGLGIIDAITYSVIVFCICQFLLSKIVKSIYRSIEEKKRMSIANKIDNILYDVLHKKGQFKDMDDYMLANAETIDKELDFVGDENMIFNLTMAFGYPYTFENGELFSPVYATTADSFINGFQENYRMMDQYLNYLEKFVYPMIRQNFRNGDIDLYKLNGYIINEIRVQSRHEEILKMLNVLHEDLTRLHKDALSIKSSINTVGSSKTTYIYYPVYY